MNKILSSLCLIAVLASATTITTVTAEAKAKPAAAKYVWKTPYNKSHKKA